MTKKITKLQVCTAHMKIGEREGDEVLKTQELMPEESAGCVHAER